MISWICKLLKINISKCIHIFYIIYLLELYLYNEPYLLNCFIYETSKIYLNIVEKKYNYIVYTP